MYWVNHFLPVMGGFILMLYLMGFMAYQLGFIDKYPMMPERPLRERRDYLRIQEILMGQVGQLSGYEELPKTTISRVDGAAEKVLLAFYDKHASVEVYLPALVCGKKQVDFRYRILLKDVVRSN